jgi:enoyl-CoA hydratase/carnithine racemase
VFSAGLDLPELLGHDRDEMLAFWQGFSDLWRLIATAPMPVVAALTGHSPAGGTVLSLFCDYRIMARGEFRVGLNETQVGLVAPPVIHHALARLVGAHAAERHVVRGALLDPDQARALGLVDELAEVDQVVPRALAWCRELLALPPQAMLGNRRLARADLHASFAERDDDGEAFLDVWFDPATQAALAAVVAQLGKARG